MTKRVLELSVTHKTEPSEIFGEYKVIGDTDPSAVVKIRKEEDVIKLLEFANRHKIPVVPLAGASSGYGSYEYGWGYENMEKARVVLPTGKTREFSDRELGKLIGTMGTTSLVTEITLKVRKLEEKKAVSASFSSASALGRAVEVIKEKKLSIWSISFLNPAWRALCKRPG